MLRSRRTQFVRRLLSALSGCQSLNPHEKWQNQAVSSTAGISLSAHGFPRDLVGRSKCRPGVLPWWELPIELLFRFKFLTENQCRNVLLHAWTHGIHKHVCTKPFRANKFSRTRKRVPKNRLLKAIFVAKKSVGLLNKYSDSNRITGVVPNLFHRVFQANDV